jgi:hypothetical protein
VLPLAALAAVAVPAGAARPQEAPREAPSIRDNSFLLEEAYNQEKGVVQHISAFLRFRDGGSWTYTFTQEWPVRGQRHQLSYTVPVQWTEAPARRAGIGDVALNYRYQLAGGGESPVAMAPRLTVLLPTGSAERGTGAGAAGVQVNVPLSVELSRTLVTHLNAGATYTPSARSAEGFEANAAAVNLGQSVIWLARPTFNVMLEAVWTRAQAAVGPGAVASSNSFFISPGVRGALNFPSGLQIVPGLAVPVGVGPSRGANAVLVYLSFEHPF